MLKLASASTLQLDAAAGAVVLDSNFYKSTSGNVLQEICANSAYLLNIARLMQALSHKCCAGKEYAKADSRYATRDSFVISMEAVTAFVWGPLCLLAVHAVSRRWAWRHMLQASSHSLNNPVVRAVNFITRLEKTHVCWLCCKISSVPERLPCV